MAINATTLQWLSPYRLPAGYADIAFSTMPAARRAARPASAHRSRIFDNQPADGDLSRWLSGVVAPQARSGTTVLAVIQTGRAQKRYFDCEPSQHGGKRRRSSVAPLSERRRRGMAMNFTIKSFSENTARRRGTSISHAEAPPAPAPVWYPPTKPG